METVSKYARNHRPAELYAFQGGKATLAEIASAKGMSVSSVCRRLKSGKSLDDPHGKQGRPARSFTFTAEELGAIVGISPSAILKRAERGQNLFEKRRHEVIQDVTNKPSKREPPTGIPMSRAEVIDGLAARLKQPGCVMTVNDALDAAYCAGMAAGRAERGTNT